jgi:hypothetical protein
LEKVASHLWARIPQKDSSDLLRSDKTGRMYRLSTPHITERHKGELRLIYCIKKEDPGDIGSGGIIGVEWKGVGERKGGDLYLAFSFFGGL